MRLGGFARIKKKKDIRPGGRKDAETQRACRGRSGFVGPIGERFIPMQRIEIGKAKRGSEKIRNPVTSNRDGTFSFSIGE